MRKEAAARIKINKLLEESGWCFFDSAVGRANISLEVNTKISQKVLDELGEDFEKTKKGFIDFLLLDKKSFPLAVLEAKREGKSPLDGKEQAREYAKSVGVRFVILSNGNAHYFWDIETGNPEIITAFPTQDSLGNKQDFKPDPARLVDEPVNDDYIALTQKPDYALSPDWIDESRRKEFVKTNGLRFLRDYQRKAINKIQEAVKSGKSRFLFEMATGTGKTLVAAGVTKLFLHTENAKRVLFLVDRLELEDQALKNIVRYLKNDYKAVIYKENKDDWIRAQIVITTVQSLTRDNKYKYLFSPVDFDLVISDEAHRSIGGNSRAVFEYFTGYKLGLTATPKDYLKHVDEKKLADKDPRKLEKRQLLDTYTTFGCSSGDPTFRYSLLDGVKDKVLVSPIVVDARTDITTNLLSKDGYAVVLQDEEGGQQEKSYFPKDFEKKFFSDETNLTFCRAFLDKALRDPISGEIGKSIIFCVSQAHASKITQVLNQLAHKAFPGKYQSDFAVQVTSNIKNAQQMSINFSNNNLNGRTTFKDGYISSKARCCVTMGMMTTGYDCEDILNIALMRPVYSPTDFIQIKGRGTRIFDFEYNGKDEAGDDERITKTKEHYKLFDFFANCVYFERHFKYDEEIKLRITLGGGGPFPPPPPVPHEYTNSAPDPLATLAETHIGERGMKIDRKFFEKFEKTLTADAHVKKCVEDGRYADAEEYIRKEVFDKPDEYFNLDKLRKSVRVDRNLTMREILDRIFGQLKHFKSKDELLEEEIQKFVSIYHPDPKFVQIIGVFMKAYILDENIRRIMQAGEFTDLANNPRFDMGDLTELDGWRTPVIEYVNNYVSLNTFM